MYLRAALCSLTLAAPAFAESYAVGDTFEDPLVIAQEAMAAFVYTEEGRPKIDVEVSVDFFNVMTILVAESGFADDSVDGIRNQYVLEQGDSGAWTLAFQRREFRCGRGLNTVTWQTDLCP